MALLQIHSTTYHYLKQWCFCSLVVIYWVDDDYEDDIRYVSLWVSLCILQILAPAGACIHSPAPINSLRSRQDGRHVADDIFKCIFLNENVRIFIWISLKFVPKGPINNIPALVQIMAWCWPGNKPLSEPMKVRLPSHICVTRPQWVNSLPGSLVFTVQMFFMIKSKHIIEEKSF